MQDRAGPRVDGMHLRPGAQLVTYPDSLGGSLREVRRLLDGSLAGLFGGIHLLPPFPSSGDRGFAPITYRTIDPRFGDWTDIESLARDHDVLLDVMVNHLSRRSEEFRELERHGPTASTAPLFLTPERVWPDGPPPAGDVARIFLRKARDPFSTITIEGTGEPLTVWTTFGTPDGFEQVDLDLAQPATRELVAGWLATLAAHGVRIVRLDAVGYVVKRAGTSCFMVEPDIWDALAWLRSVADRLDLLLLPEVHDVRPTHDRLAEHGYWTYDFVLPGLMLLTFETGDASRLADHLARSPERQFTTLDCHDGIPIHPDLQGIATSDEMRRLADAVVARGGNINHIMGDLPSGDVDVHQLNITYHAAMAGDDGRYLAARAIQLFAKGVPQVYYVGLLAGGNDHAAVTRTGEGRAINRHDYALAEVDAALARPVVQRLMQLLRIRATHPAFRGGLAVETCGASTLRLVRSAGRDRCTLRVDVGSGAMDLTVDT
ncbi:MAG: sucrose phosphorylase [Chloroflexi bacterium]|nr:sucrose phosphorylase [Chloroflexota bacterium]